MPSDLTVKTEYDNAIVFRTTNPKIYKKTLETGSLWLGSNELYRSIEDDVRKDTGEGINGTTLGFPLKFNFGNDSKLIIEETKGKIGQNFSPHYIVSLHGTGISPAQRHDFGNCTFGIRSILALSIEVVYQVSKQIHVTGYTYGPVSYQHTALVKSLKGDGSAIRMDGNPPEYLKSLNTNVLRKDPVHPFIEQDEWRIAVFTKSFYKNDSKERIKINVDVNHFYDYLPPA